MNLRARLDRLEKQSGIGGPDFPREIVIEFCKPGPDGPIVVGEHRMKVDWPGRQTSKTEEQEGEDEDEPPKSR